MFVSRDDAAKIMSSLVGNLSVVGAVSSILVDGKECKIRSRQSKVPFPIVINEINDKINNHNSKN